jgi:DNA-binding NtrC family response regulator
MRAAKKTIVERALGITDGNGAAAARLLGLNRKYFSELSKELGVKLK